LLKSIELDVVRHRDEQVGRPEWLDSIVVAGNVGAVRREGLETEDAIEIAACLVHCAAGPLRSR
jgi:hypothetical protein